MRRLSLRATTSSGCDVFLFLLEIILGVGLFLRPKRPVKTAILEHLPEHVRSKIIAGASRYPIPWWFIATVLSLFAAVLGGMFGFLKITAALLILLGIFAGMAIREVKSIRRRDVHGYLATISTNGRLHHCLVCNYNLRGSTSHTCPECGEAVLIDDLLHPRQ